MNRLLTAVACSALLTIAACSSSGSGDANPTGSAGGGQATVVSPPMSGSEHDGMSGTNSEAAGGGEHSGTATITIKDFGYAGDLTVEPGEDVTVVNEDSTAHTLTDEDTQLFDTGTITADGTGSFVAPDRPGQYPFGCIFHPEMSGVLTVQG